MIETKTQTLNLSEIKLNPGNPRKISKTQLEKLSRSLQEFPEMLSMREIIVDETMTILGGNMRYQALKKAGESTATVKVCTGLSEEQKREFIIKDNASFGEWDMGILADNWGDLPLSDWGVDLPSSWQESDYTRNIEAPIYTPKENKPDLKALYDTTKTRALIKEIDNSSLADDEKEFLRAAARRHTVFNYKRIADYYAHSETEVQALMEASALVIIDFKKAVELGYVKLSKAVAKQYGIDHKDTDDDTAKE